MRFQFEPKRHHSSDPEGPEGRRTRGEFSLALEIAVKSTARRGGARRLRRAKRSGREGDFCRLFAKAGLSQDRYQGGDACSERVAIRVHAPRVGIPPNAWPLIRCVRIEPEARSRGFPKRSDIGLLLHGYGRAKHQKSPESEQPPRAVHNALACATRALLLFSLTGRSVN